MEVEVKVIQQSMERIIEKGIQQKDLKDLLLKFVRSSSKENRLFGELCIFHYRHFVSSFEVEIYEVAAAIELLILSFDILDDFEDADTLDKPWSSNFALSLNGSTALLFLSMQAVRNTYFTYKEHAIALMEKFALHAIEGQHKDLLNSCQDEHTYMEMLEEKSGSLVSLACLVGCIIANGNTSKAVENYSKWMGVIGQINNDITDLKKWNEKNDMINKKYSLPIIYLLEVEKNREGLVSKYYRNEISKEQFVSNREIIQQKLIDTDAIRYALVIRKVFQNKVINEFSKMNFTQEQLDYLKKYTK